MRNGSSDILIPNPNFTNKREPKTSPMTRVALAGPRTTNKEKARFVGNRF